MQHTKNAKGKTAAVFVAMSAAFCASAGVKYWDNPDFKAFDVGDYVQDGLVLNYDGIRNAGPNADHDLDATTWANLGSWGNDYDMTRYSLVSSAWAAGGSTGYWTGKGFASAGSSIFHRVDQPWTLPESYSVQTLTDATSSGQGGNIGYVICPYYDNTASGADSDIQDGGLWQKNDWSRFAIGIRKTSFTYRTALSSSMYLCAENDIGSRVGVQQDSYQYMTAMMDSKTNAVIFSGIAAPWAEDSNARRSSSAPSSTAWQNGTSGRTKRTFGKGVSLLGHYPRIDELFKGTLNSIRLYSKVLSDEEVAWNRVVDEVRYFHRRGAIPVTNVVVSVSGIDGIADDHFAIDADGYTFTAPTSRTVEGKRYALGGYTLETWNGSAWVADGEGTHTGNSVTVSDTTAKVRITWQYSRPAGEGQLAHYDVSDYVTDGLMLFYDGILNQGVGNPHSYDATTWVNIGNGDGSQDWTLSLNHKRKTAGDAGSWGDDGFNFLGYSEFKKEGTLPHPTTHSIQVLIDASEEDQIYQSGSGSQAYIYATAWDYSSLAIRTLGDTPKENSLYWCAGGSSAPNRPYVLHSDGHYDYATAIMDGSAKTLALTDGVDVPSSGTLADGFYQSESDFPDYNAARIFLGGYNGGADANASLFAGKLKFFRYYPNKALTTAEVLQNRKVDEYRYFGRYVVTNVLVQSTYSYLDGYEKAGPYEVDGSYTFTAPETVTAANGITYACDGYTVEAQDGIGWTVIASGAGNAYLYNTSAGTVRLTWKWKPVSGARTAADYSLDDLSQAGLALHYDGLLNQGADAARSTTATTWVNLGSRPGMDLTRATWGSDTSKHGSWGEKGYAFTGLAQFNSASGLAWPTTFSAQAFVDARHADNTNGNGNYIAATTWGQFGMQIYGAEKVGRFNVQGTSDITKCPNFATEDGIDYMTAIHDAATKTALAFQGTKAPTGGSAADGYMHFDTFNGIENNQFRLGGWGGGPNSQNLTGTIYTFRHYDRVLTEEELVRNRNVDSARYFGALAVTNVVVSASGVETAYKVEGAHTFTAPATVVQGGDERPVQWFTTEELVDGVWRNKEWHEGAGGYTYSVDALSGKVIRLTWLATRPGMLIILR